LLAAEKTPRPHKFPSGVPGKMDAKNFPQKKEKKTPKGEKTKKP